MMKFRALTGSVALLVGMVAAAGCGSESVAGRSLASESVSVTLTGSSTIAPLVQAAAEAYEATHPDVRINVQTGGSSRGIADAVKGLNDIGMTSRALKPGEGTELTPHVVARDGVAFVVHADNAVDGLMASQAEDIFTGRVTNWSAVGGRDRPIVVVNRPEGRSELELVSSFFDLKPADMRADVVGGENQQAVKLVAGNPDAIVYLSMGTALYEAQAGTPIRVLSLDGVEASVETVVDGSYPLGRPLVLVTGERVGAAAQNFLDYLMSPAVDGVIAEQSFVVPGR